MPKGKPGPHTTSYECRQVFKKVKRVQIAKVHRKLLSRRCVFSYIALGG